MSSDEQRMAGAGLPEEVSEGLKRLGLVVPVWDRPITPEEIQYFLDRWMFLQVLSTNKVDALEEVAKIKAAKSGWTILSYGDALTSSPGEFLFGGGDFRVKLNKSTAVDEDEDGDDGDGGDTIVNPDKGTIFAQSYHTAAEMVALAKQLGWEGLHVVDGHPLMKWAAWNHAMDEGMQVSGFEPSERDVARRERIKRSEVEDAKRFVFRM